MKDQMKFPEWRVTERIFGICPSTLNGFYIRCKSASKARKAFRKAHAWKLPNSRLHVQLWKKAGE